MDRGSRWIFTKEQIENSPTRKYKICFEIEMKNRQQCSSFIQDLGLSLKLRQLCINTAMVYMHRFYMFHSMTKFEKYKMGIACLFLAAKVEESARRRETVIFQAHKLLYKKENPITLKSERYLKMSEELKFFEDILLMTLGFNVQIEHPHPIILTTCELIKADKELQKASYYMATNSLHLTTMCLQYKPSFVACFSIYISSKWLSYKIPLSSFGKPWFSYVDPELTYEILDKMTFEFLDVYEKTPTKLRRYIQIYSTAKHRVLSSKPKFTQNHQTDSNNNRKLHMISESREDNKSNDQLKNPSLLQTKSILNTGNFVSGKEFKKSDLENRQEPQNVESVTLKSSEKSMTLFDLPELEKNPRKRCASTDINCPEKRVCTSNNREESTKMWNNFSTISKNPQSQKSADITSNPTLNLNIPITWTSSGDAQKDTVICLDTFLNSFKNKNSPSDFSLKKAAQLQQNSFNTATSVLEKDTRIANFEQKVSQSQNSSLQVTQLPLAKFDNKVSLSINTVVGNNVSSKIDQSCTLNPIIDHSSDTSVNHSKNAAGDRNLLVINNVVEIQTWNNQDSFKQLPKNNVLEVSTSIINGSGNLISEISEKRTDTLRKEMTLEKETQTSGKDIPISEIESNSLGNGAQSSEKETILSGKETQISEDRCRILDRETQILDRETRILERELQILERKTQIFGRETETSDNEKNNLEKRIPILDKGAKILKKETKILGKNNIIGENDSKVLCGRNRILEKVAESSKIKQRTLEQGIQVSEKLAETLGEESKIVEKDCEKLEIRARILENEIKTSKKETKISGKLAKTSSNRTETLGKGMETLGKGTETLDGGTKTLDRRTKTLDRRTKTIDRRTETLGKVKETLDRGTEVLDKGTEHLNKGTKTLEKVIINVDKGSCILDKEIKSLPTRIESSVNMFEVSNGTIDSSSFVSNFMKEKNNNINEKCRNHRVEENKRNHKSKKSKKEKDGEKKEKRKKEEERKKVREHKQNRVEEANTLRAAPMTSIKISIPKEKLNLNDNILFSESKLKSQENSLKIQIPKELVLDTNFNLPLTNQSLQASLTFQFDNGKLDKNTSEMTWMNHQRMQPVYKGY